MNYNPTLHKLSNGVTVILDPMDLETVNVKVLFRIGSRDEAPHEYGITHFCEHMLCKGTTRFPTQRHLKEYLEYHGGARNASTGNNRITFYGRIIAENLNILIDLIGDQIQNSLFDPEKIELERKVIADERRRALDNPGRQFGDFISGKLFNYAVFSYRTLGPFENIASFSRAQMLGFLARRLSAKNCIIGISGKINDIDGVLKHLEKTFAFLPFCAVDENTAITYTPQIAHNLQSDKKNIKLDIYFPEIFDATYENRFKNMCVAKFKRHLIQELQQVVRQQNGLVYGLGSCDLGNEKMSVTGISTETAAENIAQVVKLIASTSHKIYSQNTITDETLNRFRNMNKLSRADFLESPSQRCDTLISEYRWYDRLYDFYETKKMSDSITRDDVIENSRGFFAGPMSIMTQGADFKDDLNAIWIENFK